MESFPGKAFREGNSWISISESFDQKLRKFPRGKRFRQNFTETKFVYTGSHFGNTRASRKERIQKRSAPSGRSLVTFLNGRLLAGYYIPHMVDFFHWNSGKLCFIRLWKFRDIQTRSFGEIFMFWYRACASVGLCSTPILSKSFTGNILIVLVTVQDCADTEGKFHWEMPR